jgi:hypothetical protein
MSLARRNDAGFQIALWIQGGYPVAGHWRLCAVSKKGAAEISWAVVENGLGFLEHAVEEMAEAPRQQVRRHPPLRRDVAAACSPPSRVFMGY